MWTLESRISGNLGGSLIEPVDVLYEYDEPMIFTARIGILSVLVRKMTQLRDTALYVVVTVDPEKLDYLRQGKLSVRGAFAEEACWIIELDENYGAQRYWEIKTDLIPKRYIPKAGVGITHWVGFVPDDVEQINALLAIKFRGETLKADGMPFGKFKKLVDRSYAAARRALTPAILMGSRIASFDLEIAQPKFRSLLIAVKQPVFNPSMVRRLQRQRAIDRTILNDAVRSNQAQFAESIKFIAENVGRPALDREYTAQRYGLFYSLASILPTDDGDISDVEFTTNVAGNISTVVFDRNSARAVRGVIQDAERGNITEIGVIGGLIDRTSSVLLNSDRGKSVRCDFPREQFVELVAGAVLQIGVALELKGPITLRPRRDVLDVRSFRVLNAGDEDGEVFNVFG